jgi:hypothetical protein
MVDPRQAMCGLQRLADRVCVLTLSGAPPAFDIKIVRTKSVIQTVWWHHLASKV